MSCVDGLAERDSQGLRHRKEEKLKTANTPDSSHESRAMAGASAEGIVGVKKFYSLDERFADAHRPSSTSLCSSIVRTTRCRFFLLGFLSTIKPVRFCLEKVYSPFHLQGFKASEPPFCSFRQTTKTIMPSIIMTIKIVNSPPQPPVAMTLGLFFFDPLRLNQKPYYI